MLEPIIDKDLKGLEKIVYMPPHQSFLVRPELPEVIEMPHSHRLQPEPWCFG